MPAATKEAGSKRTKRAAKPKAQRVVKASSDNKPKQTATEAPRSSIRQLIRSMITAGKSTQEITAALEVQFPDSKAFQKAGKHISFYRAQLKKELAAAASA